MVVSAEVLRNVAHQRSGVTIFAFLNGELEGRGLYDDPNEVPSPTGTNQIIFLPIENAIDSASPAALAVTPFLDARIVLSFTLAKRAIWPAIDPLLSTSRQMDPHIADGEHYAVAHAVRDLLRRERDLLEAAPDGRLREFTDDERRLIARARRAQRFFSQPFAVAEDFTGRAGQVVPLTETIRAYKALLAGEYDGLPEDAFTWRGALPVA
jgi:F-type H+-transporting ATPase subunit beta